MRTISLLTATGGDVQMARELLIRSYAPSQEEALAQAMPVEGGGYVNAVYDLSTGAPGPYSGPMMNYPDYISPYGNSIGHIGIVGGEGTWIVNQERTAAMNAAVRQFDRQVGLGLAAPIVAGGLFAGGAAVMPGILSAGRSFVYANALRIGTFGQFATDIAAGASVSTYLPAGAGVATASLATIERAGSVERGGLNLFKWGSDTTVKAGGWREGDYMLLLRDQGSPKANWSQNAGRLREEMSKGQPIFDSYRDPVTNLQIPTKGFLGAERNLLESRGWIYNSAIGAYYPSVP